MSRLPPYPEGHFVNRIGWLRAAVLGANDGILSTASLIVGVAAAATTQNEVLIAGVAGLVAGAMSMAPNFAFSLSLDTPIGVCQAPPVFSSRLIYVNARMNSFQHDLTPRTQKDFDANDT
jgi:hypothetical protein